MKKVIKINESDINRIIKRIINENIDDVLDKMNRGEKLSYEDKRKMSDYAKHLSSGGNENDFKYHRVSELKIAEPNSTDHMNQSQIIVHVDHSTKIDPKYVTKNIAMILSKSNIDSVVGYRFVIFSHPNGYFVKVNNNLVEKAISILQNYGFSVGMNPAYNQRTELPNRIKNSFKNSDITISSDSEAYQNLNLSDEQFVDRLSKLIRKFGINNSSVTKYAISINDKSKIDDLIKYLNKKGYDAKKTLAI